MDDRDYKYIIKKLLQITDDGFVIMDKDGYIADINDTYCSFLKTSREDAVGKKIGDIISATRLPHLMKTKTSEEGEVIKIGQDTGFTEDAIVMTNRAGVSDEKGNPIGGIAQVKFRLQTVDSAQKLMKKYNELEYYKDAYMKNADNHFEGALGSSEIFNAVKKQGIRVAKTSFPVLLTGETGTGKEVFANAIHNASDRRDKPMISINCAAIPGELLESELFGYEEGSFTGAKKGGKKGKIELASGGTLFLDEIGDMPLIMQAKLLRVLQEKEIEKIGGYKTIPVDIRVIAATRKNLEEMIENGEFREDLYYRLNVINIEMPPLRKRKSDIPVLARHFLSRLNKEYHTNVMLSDEVLECFGSYSWPGNIRELDNIIKSAYASCNSFYIRLMDIPSKMVASHKMGSTENNHEVKRLSGLMDEYEKSIIMEELRRSGWNCKKAAEELGIHKSLLYKKIDKYSIDLNRERYEAENISANKTDY